MNSSLEGSIHCKNQLDGRPRFHIQLNKNIVKGKEPASEPNSLFVDDMNFHPSVDVEEFENTRRLSLTGPEGEFAIMNYRSTHQFYPPILIQPSVEQVSEYKLDVVLKVTTNFSPELKCDELLLSFHTPATTSSCKCELPDDAKKQATDYSEMKRLVMWKIGDASGQREFFLHVIIMLTKPCDAFTVKSMGSIALGLMSDLISRLNFTIRNMSLSGMSVQGVEIDRLTNRPDAPQPYLFEWFMIRNQWIRYIVKSSSYVCRF